MKKPRIAKVILPIALEREFDYLLPDSLNVKTGSRLLVDFRGVKTVAVLSEIAHNSAIEKIKPVIEALDTNPALPQDAIKFAKQLSEYYPYPL
ncbi:MAG: primosomal protein N', partial [Candidatus Omnitrophota bacterium]